MITDDELLNDDVDKTPNELSFIYMQSVRLANKPDRMLITEDWTATQIDFKAYSAISAANWLSMMDIGNSNDINDYLARLNYIGCSISGQYIYEQYKKKTAKEKVGSFFKVFFSIILINFTIPINIAYNFTTFIYFTYIYT